MSYLLRIVIAGLAFAIGLAAVRAAEFVIGGLWPVEHAVVAAVPPDPYGAVFDTVDDTLAEPVTIKVNGIGIRATEREVMRRFGKPNKVVGFYENEAPDDRYKVFDYDDMTITLDHYQNGKWTVGGISVYSPKWDVSGFHVGSSVDEVYRAIGRSYDVEQDSLNYTDPYGWRIWIHLVDGRVDIIDVGYPGC